MKHQFVRETLPYTGEALSNHWIYRNFGTMGDAVVAFVGPCRVDQDHMVDLEDVLNDDTIYSTQMLHFIVEVFGIPLQEGVLIQRLFSAILQDKLNHLLGDFKIQRRGDDLFFNDTQKLSVSICTLSPTSILIHAGLNVDSQGAPVEAAGLISDLHLSQDAIEPFAMSCMRTLADEWQDIRLSCCKVRAVV
ncbi:MAG: DUF366 family protein [Candidatus Melainabacteria bacterium]|nr:DUF366 family protein [Candidatus Melainabacteria bacterium]